MTAREQAEETQIEETQVEDSDVEETNQVENEEHDYESADDEELLNQLIERMSTKMESIVDRRVTSLMKTLKNDYGLTKKTETPTETTTSNASKVPDTINERLLRLAIKEELQLHDFESKEELAAARSLALDFASRVRLDVDDDPDEIAESIVEQVVKTMGSMKETYQKQLRSELKKRGVLRDEEDETKSPSRTKAGDSHTAQKQWDRGAELARKKFGTHSDEEA